MSSQPSSQMMRHEVGKDAKESMAAAFTNSEVFREKAVAILQAKWRTIHAKQVATTSYTMAAWPEFQADSNASLRTIEEILKEVFNVGGINSGE